jgi:hypothetical protein
MRKDLVVLLCICITQALCEAPFKLLAGPPSEFDLHRLPSPVSGSLVEKSSYLEAQFTPKSGNPQAVEWYVDTVHIGYLSK